jgi:beta-lactam-binding protein with PASTA domain
MIQLPSALQGQNYEDMKAKLESQGFTVHGTEVERSDVIPGCIVSCNFAAGESVAYGSVIEFTVAVAPATTAAPTEATTEQAAPASEE